MKFRVLKGFWRKLGQKDGNEIDCGTSNDQQSTFSYYYEHHHCYSHRPIPLFKFKQEILNYIIQSVESVSQAVSAYLSSLHNNDNTDDNQPHCDSADNNDTQKASSPLSCAQHGSSCISKETILSCTRWREELITALDLCLLAVPDEEAEVTDSKDEKSAGTGNTKGHAVQDCREDKELETIRHETCDVAVNFDNNSTTCTAPAISICTLQQWRALLRQIVSCLLKIDRFLYVETVLRLRQLLYPLATSTTSLQLSPRRATVGGRVGCSSTSSTRNSLRDSGFLENQHVYEQLRKGATSSGLKTSAINHSDGKNQEIRRAEERVALMKRIITWVILDNILRHQEGESDCFSSLLRSENSTREKNKPTNYSGLLRWNEIVEDLMNIYSTSQHAIVEILISLWILSDANGHEFVQSFLQKPSRNLNDVMLIKQNTATDDEHCDSKCLSLTEMASCQNTLLSMSIFLAERPVDDDTCVIDKLVDNVENIFEQALVLAWVNYLEQQSSSPFSSKKTDDSVIVPMDLYHCHMMAIYAVCSPCWDDKKQNYSFHLIQSVWDDWDEQVTQYEAKKESISNSQFLTKGSTTSDGGETTILNNQQKGFCTQQSTLEKEKYVSEGEVFSSSYISSLSFSQSNSLTVFRGTEANNMPFEEDVLTFMAIESWVATLHLRVEQCLNKRFPHFLKEAERCLCKEREMAYATRSFLCSQKALESLVKVQFATGNYSAAFESASAHFNNVKNKCLWENYCDRCTLTYLNSIQLLTEIQEVFKADAAFVEVGKLAIQHLKFCEKALVASLYKSGTNFVRHVVARRGLYDAKVSCLREIWRAYYRMNDALNATKYFEEYFELITYRCGSRQNEIAYAALKERGKQLENEKRHDSAVCVFQRAVEEAKKHMTFLTTATTPEAKTRTITAGQDASNNNNNNNNDENDENDNNNNNDDNNSNGDDAPAQVGENVMREHELKLIRRKAESERNLALAYVKQAKHEVNIRKRREQLNNASTSAYTSLNILKRCLLKVTKPPLPAGVLLDVASSIVVAAKALLHLGQPKKAALLLEPLIEEKANSASVRPALWSNAPPPLHVAQSFAPAETVECIKTVEVKIAAYELHTLCLSKFDGERACREIAIAREFLLEVKNWLTPFVANNHVAVIKNNGENVASLEENFLAKVNIKRKTVFKVLQMTNALLSNLTIIFGDSLALLGKWENALEEYSNALAMYAEDGAGGSDNNEYNHEKTEKDEERLRIDKKIGESMVLAKLAEVYTALDKPKTAVHYYHQVLDYAFEVGDAMLQYNALIHLARLYTITKEFEDVGEHWAKVSELAKEYEDPVISRETTRNIVADQRAKGMYTAVVNKAKELDELAFAAEGVDAAADRQFALEALADAYLQLGQHRNCIDTLDILEKVQFKCGEWKDPLFKIRARALIGDGAVKEAIKVLMTWASDARKFGNLVELGHANNGLALAYAGVGCFFKTRQRYEIALYAFSKVSSMDRECRNAVREAAQWLLYHFYLNNEEILLTTNYSEKEEFSTSDINDEASSKKDHSSPPPEVPSVSGNLLVLLQKEEMSRTKQFENGSVISAVCSDGDDNDGDDYISNVEFVRDERSEKNFSVSSSFCDVETTENGILSLLSVNVKNSNAKKDVVSKSIHNVSTASVDGLGALQQSQSTPTQTLANVTHCKRPAVMDGEVFVTPEQSTANVSDTLQEKQYPLRSRAAKVRTFCFRRALETIEKAAQLSLIPPSIRKQLIPRSPADVVDLALVAYPHCTFVFYSVEFGAQYRAIVRPASSLFFFERSLQVFSLGEFHNKKRFEELLLREAKASVSSDSSHHVRIEPAEKRSSVFTSSFTSLTWKSCSNSAGVTSVARDQDNNGWAEINKTLKQDLQNLHADLWGPVQDSLRAAGCCSDGVECLVFVVDPTLLHIPFPALCSSEAGAIPLGQQFTVAVTPTVVSFLQEMRRCEDSSLLAASQIDRSVLLPEQTEQNTSFSALSQHISPLQSLVSSAKSPTRTSMEDQHNHVSGTAANASLLAAASHPWTIFTGCTRKEVISAFTSPTCRGLMLLCDPVGHLFRVADGMVRLEDMTRGCPCLANSHDLIVVTCDRSVTPAVDEPGVAARLCLQHGCRRVLRLDLSHGVSSISFEHLQLLHLYVENLTLTLKWRMRYPYALALRMTQQEALRRKFSTVVSTSLTLIGAA